MNHTDRAVADLLDAVREISPSIAEAMVRYALAEGVAGLMLCAILAILLALSYTWIQKIKDEEDRDAWMAGWGLGVGLSILFGGMLFHYSLIAVIAPEGTAIMDALEALRR